MVRVCPKCGYERKADEPVPETECPQCGAIYAKIEQALRKAEEPEPQNPDPQEPQPDKDEPPSVEEKSAKLTAFLYEQSQLSREKTRTFGLAITVIPAYFLGQDCSLLAGKRLVRSSSSPKLSIFRATKVGPSFLRTNPLPGLLLRAG